MRRHAACFREVVLPALARQGIEITHWAELSGAERRSLRLLFRDRIYPVMTPLLVDPAHPFPHISGPVAQPRGGRRRPADGGQQFRPGAGPPDVAAVS